MRQLLPFLPRIQQRQSHIPNDLQSCSHVFIRTDSERKPLQPPTPDLTKSLLARTKYFTIIVNGKEQNISIDRLKTAHFHPEITPHVTAKLPKYPDTPQVIPLQPSPLPEQHVSEEMFAPQRDVDNRLNFWNIFRAL